jgi:hypothetical protein
MPTCVEPSARLGGNDISNLLRALDSLDSALLIQTIMTIVLVVLTIAMVALFVVFAAAVVGSLLSKAAQATLDESSPIVGWGSRRAVFISVQHGFSFLSMSAPGRGHCTGQVTVGTSDLVAHG